MNERDPPTLFADDAAFRWQNLWSAPVVEAVQKEMNQVSDKIEALFSPQPLK